MGNKESTTTRINKKRSQTQTSDSLLLTSIYRRQLREDTRMKLENFIRKRKVLKSVKTKILEYLKKIYRKRDSGVDAKIYRVLKDDLDALKNHEIFSMLLYLKWEFDFTELMFEGENDASEDHAFQKYLNIASSISKNLFKDLKKNIFQKVLKDFDNTLSLYYFDKMARIYRKTTKSREMEAQTMTPKMLYKMLRKANKREIIPLGSKKDIKEATKLLNDLLASIKNLAKLISKLITLFLGARTPNFENTQQRRFEHYLQMCITLNSLLKSSIKSYQYCTYLIEVLIIAKKSQWIENRVKNKGKFKEFEGLAYLQKFLKNENARVLVRMNSLREIKLSGVSLNMSSYELTNPKDSPPKNLGKESHFAKKNRYRELKRLRDRHYSDLTACFRQVQSMRAIEDLKSVKFSKKGSSLTNKMNGEGSLTRPPASLMGDFVKAGSAQECIKSEGLVHETSLNLGGSGLQPPSETPTKNHRSDLGSLMADGGAENGQILHKSKTGDGGDQSSGVVGDVGLDFKTKKIQSQKTIKIDNIKEFVGDDAFESYEEEWKDSVHMLEPQETEETGLIEEAPCSGPRPFKNHENSQTAVTQPSFNMFYQRNPVLKKTRSLREEVLRNQVMPAPIPILSKSPSLRVTKELPISRTCTPAPDFSNEYEISQMVDEPEEQAKQLFSGQKMSIQEFLAHLNLDLKMNLDSVFSSNLDEILDFFDSIEDFMMRILGGQELEVKIDLMRLIIRTTKSELFIDKLFLHSRIRLDFLEQWQTFSLFIQVLIHEVGINGF